MNTHFPSLKIVLLAILYSSFRFENRTWISSRQQGLKGESKVFDMFIDLTCISAMIFSFVFLGAYYYDNGIIPLLFLLAIVFIVGLFTAYLSDRLFKGDNIFVWMVSTIGIWPVAFILANNVSWFGLVKIS